MPTIPTQRDPWDDDPEVARLAAQDAERDRRATHRNVGGDLIDPQQVLPIATARGDVYLVDPTPLPRYGSDSKVDAALHPATELPGRWSWPAAQPPATPPSPAPAQHARRKPSLLERLRLWVRRG